VDPTTHGYVFTIRLSRDGEVISTNLR